MSVPVRNVSSDIHREAEEINRLWSFKHESCFKGRLRAVCIEVIQNTTWAKGETYNHLPKIFTKEYIELIMDVSELIGRSITENMTAQEFTEALNRELWRVGCVR
jgi:hypothetical protein